jgi:hypothetical protein
MAERLHGQKIPERERAKRPIGIIEGLVERVGKLREELGCLASELEGKRGGSRS